MGGFLSSALASRTSSGNPLVSEDFQIEEWTIEPRRTGWTESQPWRYAKENGEDDAYSEKSAA
jgi:hypothetical protein